MAKSIAASTQKRGKPAVTKGKGGNDLVRVADNDGNIIVPPVMIKSTHPIHVGQPVKVGPYTVFAGGTQDLYDRDFLDFDVLVPLTHWIPKFWFGRSYHILAAQLKDFSGVPAGWARFLRGKVIPLLESEKRVLAFCVAGHGRTGTFLASLIAILEPETSDPIQAVRDRYCHLAVETLQQAQAIFALKSQDLPEHYLEEFSRVKRSL